MRYIEVGDESIFDFNIIEFCVCQMCRLFQLLGAFLFDFDSFCYRKTKSSLPNFAKNENERKTGRFFAFRATR